jgi:hypothetical protein
VILDTVLASRPGPFCANPWAHRQRMGYEGAGSNLPSATGTSAQEPVLG